MLSCLSSVTDHKQCKTYVNHKKMAPEVQPMFLPHFDIICDIFFYRGMATKKLFCFHMIKKDNTVNGDFITTSLLQ